MLYFFLLISLCFAEDIFIVTNNPNGNINETGKFRLINIPKKLEMKEYTFCLRFKTARFAGLQCVIASDHQCMLETVAGKKCGGNDMECFDTQNILKSVWDTKKVFALWESYTAFEIWRPQVWNTLCWTEETNQSKIMVNGKIILEHSGYEKSDYEVLIDFQYMNFEDRKPLNGAITDLNIWNRTLSSEELNSWRLCNSLEGNILNWTTVQLDITGLTKEKINKTELCQDSSDDQLYKAFNQRLGFFDSAIFCQRFGAVASAHDSTSLDRMMEAYEKIDNKICGKFGSHAGIAFRQVENRNLGIFVFLRKNFQL